MVHYYSLLAQKPQRNTTAGSRIDVRSRELPVLKGMSLSLLTLQPKGVREPHWHPNVHELSYCLEGSGLMTIFSPRGGHDTFTLSAGDIAFVPMGYLHHIQNTSDKPFKLLLCFNHEEPEDLDISAGISVMPNHIMGETFKLKGTFFAGLKKNIQGVFATEVPEQPLPPYPMMPGRYRFALEEINPQIETPGGWVKISNGSLLPPLEDLAVFSVLLKPGGAREPHWHPNASELNYLIKGSAKLTLLSPGGKVENFEMNAGDMSFLPRGYLHHIENIGKEDAQFAIFFNHVEPNDIGMSGSLGAYPNEVLASLFGVPSSYFTSLPKFQQDIFVIGGG